MIIGFFLGVLNLSLVGIVGWLFVASSRSNKQETLASSFLTFIAAILIICILWLGAWLLIPIVYGEPTGPGVAGDMFGIITSLFSGLAFAGLVSTLLMQRQELALQRGELRNTREEFSRQRFENTLFSIVDLLVSHIEQVEFRLERSNEGLRDDGLLGDASGISVLSGRAVFEYCASELPDQIPVIEEQATMFGWEIHDILKQQKSGYEDLYEIEYQSFLGPYYRLLYNAIRHIEKSALSDEEKQTYSKIVRAHLSTSELKLLLFNGVSSMGRDFKPWIEKYSLLKHISPDDLATNPVLRDQYCDSAYGH